jgi:phytoene dehydrogenase-like protein
MVKAVLGLRVQDPLFKRRISSLRLDTFFGCAQTSAIVAAPVKGKYDAVVVGSGPNGLTAAVVLARAGLSVLVLEAQERIGGACRTAELTLPGFKHDVCSAIHPMGVLSPIFGELQLENYGLQWTYSPEPLAHPVLEGNAGLLRRSLQQTADGLGTDARSWEKTFRVFLGHQREFFGEILKPIRIPTHPFLMARFGLTALRSCESVLGRFKTQEARALFAGCAAHSILPLDRAGTAAFGVILALTGHAVGWPCARGGSMGIVEALESCLRSHGGEVVTGTAVRSLKDVPESRAVLFDLTPRQLAEIAGDQLPVSYVRQCGEFKYGPGVFKVDWALSQAIPWANPACARAATVHVCGTAEEVMESEAALGRGQVSERPFVLVAQQSMFDDSRAPAGKHTGWAYCHVPNGCTVDMTATIEAQMERFAPGFRDTILARHTMSPSQYQQYNANLIGGDIGGGANTLRQFLFRPFVRWDPYSTPNPRLFICSSSTPPGGGVHGMCGYWAARSALKRVFKRGVS